MKRTKIVAFLTLLVIICILMLGGCKTAWREFGNYDDPAKYTTSQHIERISKIVRENYIGDGEFTDFAVYPLYDKDDEVIMYLVEFEPRGYYYILAAKPNILTKRKMYVRHTTVARSEWQRYRISDTQPQEFEGKTWQNKVETIGANEEYIREPQKWYESDENGFIKLSVSPYKAANAGKEKKYLLSIEKKRLFYSCHSSKR